MMEPPMGPIIPKPYAVPMRPMRPPMPEGMVDEFSNGWDTYDQKQRHTKKKTASGKDAKTGKAKVVFDDDTACGGSNSSPAIDRLVKMEGNRMNRLGGMNGGMNGSMGGGMMGGMGMNRGMGMGCGCGMMSQTDAESDSECECTSES